MLEKTTYLGSDELEMKKRAQKLLDEAPRCFERDFFTPGHFTGSAFVLSPDGKSCLLTHHRKLNMWIQLGGHADGEADLLNVALREAQEESGIEEIEVVLSEMFDLDIHLIPENKKEPAHYHYDARYLFRAKTDMFLVSDESHDLAWVPLREIEKFTDNLTVQRMARKALRLQESLALS